MKWVRGQLVQRYPRPEDQEQLAAYAPLILKLFLLDLEMVRPQLQARYAAQPRGTPPRDPVMMLRSLVSIDLMHN